MKRSRFCVLSGCQMEGLVSALQILFPQSDVEGFHTYRLLGEQGDEIRERVRSADFVFTMPLEARFGELSRDAIESLGPKVQFVPQVIFPAFHPDIMYIYKDDASCVQSPLTDYNSNIAASAFLLGLTTQQTIRLYNSFVYKAMGYFDLIDASGRDLLSDFAAHGMVLQAALERWKDQPAAFMYSTNHPKGFVLADVALEASRVADLDVPALFTCPNLMPDRLAEWVIYPVFPEIAKRIGKQGNYCFKALSFDRMNIMGLEEFVERSFRLYENEDPSHWIISKRLESSRDRIAGLVGRTAALC